MYKRQPSKSLSVMERRVPKSEKYAHVQGILDTGMTVSKLKVISSSEYARRRDEIFCRVTRRQMSELYAEYEADEYESITETQRCQDGSPKIMTYEENDRQGYEKPYLILDMRERFEYDRGHLLQARNFPLALLRRDKIPPELYSFRNKAGCLIILYCDDERVSREAAKTFVDRGTENVFLLSGGMAEFAAEFPFYIEGEVPPTPAGFRKESMSTRSPRLGKISEHSEAHYGGRSPSTRGGGGGGREGRSVAGSQQGSPARSEITNGPKSARSPASGGGIKTLSSLRRSPMSGRQASSRGFRDDRSESGYSVRSDVSVAESVISRAESRKGRF